MLYYEVKGEGRSLVLLHGYLENLKMWDYISTELSQFYKIIAIDLPGHGHSKVFNEVHRMEYIATKVQEVLMELEEEKVVMVGHSMGGYVTLAFAEHFPELLDGFILLNSTSLADSDDKKEQRFKAIDMAQKNLDALIKMSIPTLFAEKNRIQMKDEMEKAREQARETSVEGVSAALKGMLMRPDRTSVLHESEVPIGIVIGRHDQAINPEELKKVIPLKNNLSFIEIDTGHMSHYESPALTCGFIRDFVSKLG